MYCIVLYFDSFVIALGQVAGPITLAAVDDGFACNLLMTDVVRLRRGVCRAQVHNHQ
jgi:hypothetical protein